jgi:seryl-tRNA synthetase
MKRVLFASLVLFIVLLAYAAVIAQGKERGGGGGQQQKTEKVGQSEKQAKSEANEQSEKGKQREVQTQERTRDRKRGREEPTAEQKEQQKQKQKQIQEKAAQAKEKGQEAEKLKAGGKEHQQQLKALDEQLAHEQGKHADRVARLERMRELAAAEGDTKTVARIDKLAEKEQQRFDGRLKNMEEKRAKILELAESAEGKDVQPAVKEVEDKAEEAGKQEQKTEAEK